MADRDAVSPGAPHPGGNPEFWTDDAVREYDRRQALIAEGKGEALDAVVRILTYFYSLRPTGAPLILDVGCGPGTLSTRVLDALETCVLVGVDASDQMVDAAGRNLKSRYGDRFDCYTGDFNSDGFWTPGGDRAYDYIVSSGALHYLSDARRPAFLTECHAHLRDGGAFVANIGTRSKSPEIAQMQETFRIEYAYQKVSETRDVGPFDDFRSKFEEREREAQINWRSYRAYVAALETSGFRQVALVRQHWVRSTIVALK